MGSCCQGEIAGKEFSSRPRIAIRTKATICYVLKLFELLYHFVNHYFILSVFLFCFCVGLQFELDPEDHTRKGKWQQKGERRLPLL